GWQRTRPGRAVTRAEAALSGLRSYGELLRELNSSSLGRRSDCHMTGDWHHNAPCNGYVISECVMANQSASTATPPGSQVSDILPLPNPPFRGSIATSYADSKADVMGLPSAPAGAPNVLLILLDDVGFGQTSTFGGPVNTPTLQRLANEGVRYNRFHTT